MSQEINQKAVDGINDVQNKVNKVHSDVNSTVNEKLDDAKEAVRPETKLEKIEREVKEEVTSLKNDKIPGAIEKAKAKAHEAELDQPLFLSSVIVGIAAVIGTSSYAIKQYQEGKLSGLAAFGVAAAGTLFGAFEVAATKKYK